MAELAAADVAVAEGVPPAQLADETGVSVRLARVAREAWRDALFEDEELRADYDAYRRAATLRLERPVSPLYDDPSAFRALLDVLGEAKAPLAQLRKLGLTGGDVERLVEHWRGRLPADTRSPALPALQVGSFALHALMPEVADADAVRPDELPWNRAARERDEAEQRAAEAFAMRPPLPEPEIDPFEEAQQREAERRAAEPWTKVAAPEETLVLPAISVPLSESTAAVDVAAVMRAFAAAQGAPPAEPVATPSGPGISVPLKESTELALAAWSVPAVKKVEEPIVVHEPATVGKVNSIERYAELAVRLEHDPSTKEALAADFGVPLEEVDDLVAAWSAWVANSNMRRAEWRLHRARILAALKGSTP